MAEIISTIEEAKIAFGESSETFKLYKNAFEYSNRKPIEAIAVTEKISKTKVIARQAEQMQELCDELMAFKSDYRKQTRKVDKLLGKIERLESRKRRGKTWFTLGAVCVGITWVIARYTA